MNRHKKYEVSFDVKNFGSGDAIDSNASKDYYYITNEKRTILSVDDNAEGFYCHLTYDYRKGISFDNPLSREVVKSSVKSVLMMDKTQILS